MLIISNHRLWTCQRCRYCEAKDIDKDVGRRIWRWEDCGDLGFQWRWATWVTVPERWLSVKVQSSGRGDPHSYKWRLWIHLLLGILMIFWVLGFTADSAHTSEWDASCNLEMSCNIHLNIFLCSRHWLLRTSLAICSSPDVAPRFKIESRHSEIHMPSHPRLPLCTH